MVDKKTSAKRPKVAPAADGLPDSGGAADAGVPAQIELRGIETLVPYARNSRTHSDAQVAELAASIDEFGLVGGIVVRDGVIAKGHGTLQGCIKLLKAGKSLYPAPGRAGGARPYPDGQIPIIDASGWTDAQFRAFVIADNRLALNADWNYEMLAVELDDLRDMDFDLNLLGFDQQELNDMIGTAGSGPESVEGEDDAPEPPENPVTKADDVWLLGVHRVMCGDSTDAGSVALLMAGGLADMVFTDPPYNLSFKGQDLSCTTKDGKRVDGHVSANSKHNKIHNDELGKDEFFQFMCKALERIKETKPSAWYFCFTDLKLEELLNPLRECGFNWKSIIVWMKNQATLSGKDYKSRYEPIIYGCESGAFHGVRYEQEDIWQFQRTLKNDLHPTMKPIPLIECAIGNSSKEGQTVIDFFGGSGSTLIACEKTDRRARLMELDPRYCDVIVRRWQDFTGKVATLEGDGRTFEQIADERIGATA